MTDIQLDGMGLYARLAAAAREVGPIEKGERNTQQGFDFRSIEQITGRARTVFARYGLALVPTRVVSVSSAPVESSRGAAGWRTTVTMEYSLGANVGDRTESLTLQMAGEAVDYGDKSTSKAVQMAFKYALTEALLIGAEADADAETHDLKPVPDLSELIAAQVAVFDRWTLDERRRQWVDAVHRVGATPTTPAQVAAVVAEMAKVYATDVADFDRWTAEERHDTQP